MKKIADFIIKYAKPIVIIIVLITILAGSQLKNLKVEDDITKYMPVDDPEIKFYEQVSEKFGKYDENTSLISLEYKDLFTLKNLNSFKDIIKELEQAPYIKSVNSFLSIPKIISTEVGIEVRDLVEIFPTNEKEAKELKTSLLNDDLVRGKFISENGKVALIMIETKEGIEGSDLKQKLENTITPLKDNALQVHYFGVPIITAMIAESSKGNMRLAIIAALVILLLLFYCFRSLRGTFLPIIVALMSSIWVLGFVGSIGKTVTIVISAIPVLMLSLVTAYGIHFISRYYEERQKINSKDSINLAIQYSFIPILMSALTTMAGFSSLTTVAIRPMTEFGIFSTFGIFLAFVLVIFLIGAFLTIFSPRTVHQKFSYQSNDLVSKLLRLISHSLLKNGKWVVVTILTVLIISIFFAFKIKPDSSIEERLGENNSVTKTMNYFKEKFSGVDFLYVYVESNNIKNPYILRTIKKIEDYSQGLPSLDQPSSIATFIMQLNEAMENKKIIPDSEEKIDNLWFLAGDNEYIKSMVANNDKNTLLQIKAKEMTSIALDHSIDKIKEFITSLPKKVKKIEFSEIKDSQKEEYYTYLADEIISSLSAKGIKINDQRNLRNILIKIANISGREFVQNNQKFLEEVLTLSSLEIEDLGLTTEEIYPWLAQYIAENESSNFFVKQLSDNLKISQDDALYLQEEIDNSIVIAQEKEKVRFAQVELDKVLGNKLQEDEKDILWYLTDKTIYIPDDQGEINLSLSLTGIPVITKKVNDSVFRGLIKSMLTAFIVVFIMLTLQFRSFTIGFFGMIPILLTIITAFGIMGMTNIKLHIGTMMVASIAIGAGIDYTIHYISRYKSELIKRSKEEAMKVTLTGTGRAIVFNSISVAAGVFVLSFSQIKMLTLFGKLIGSVMLLSVIYTLLLLPLLLNKIKLKKE